MIMGRYVHFVSRTTFFNLLLFGSFTYLCLWFQLNQPLHYDFHNSNISSGCVIPDLDPFDKDIVKLTWHPKPIVCEENLDLITVDGIGNLHINNTVQNLKKLGNVTCAYQLIERIGDTSIKFQPEVSFRFPVYVSSDVFLVKCKNVYLEIVYSRMHHNIDYRRTSQEKTFRNENDEDLSVYIFGVGSVSRLAALRHLPKTMKYLTEQLGALTFKGHTVIGENSLPNVLGLLAGKTDVELKVKEKDAYMDELPLVWNAFSNTGYACLYAEDSPGMAAFNFMTKGFKEQPVDHYLRPFFLAIEKLKPVATWLDKAIWNIEHKYIQLYKYSSLCYGNRAKHTLLIEYYTKFINAYKGKLKFGFSWITEISHNYASLLELGDDDFYEFIKWLHRNGHFEKSVLLFLSDHGSRIDEIRNTKVGRVEVRMPLLSIVLPDHLKQKCPKLVKNMRDNTHVLTSHFDTYETLLDILNKNFVPKDVSLSTKLPRGISLFRKIPPERNCQDASIPENFCACYLSESVNTTNLLINKVGDFIVKEINKLLAPISKLCAKLKLHSIKAAQKIFPGMKRIKKHEEFHIRNVFVDTKEPVPDNRFMVLIQTAPGDALFEATVDQLSDGTLNVVGTLTRNNKYGNQSSCIEKRLLKPYCLCKGVK